MITPQFAIYDINNRQLVYDLTPWLTVNMDFNSSILGGGSGFVELEAKDLPVNVNDLKKYRYYCKYGTTQEIYPGIIKGAEIVNLGSIVKVEFMGASEYFETIPIFPFNKPVTGKVVLPEEDKSFIMNVHGKSALELIKGIIFILKDNIAKSGSPQHFIGDVLPAEPLTGGLSRSYRISGHENNTFGSVLGDLTNDNNLQLLEITTDQRLTDALFDFRFSLKQESIAHEIDLDSLPGVYSVSFSNEDFNAGRFVRATGTDLSDRQVVVNQPYVNTMAYSFSPVDVPQEKNSNIEGLVEELVANGVPFEGMLTFTMETDNYNLLDYITMQGVPNLGTLRGLIVEKSIAGRTVTYSVQVTPQIDKIAVLQKPAGELRSIIFNPLKENAKNSKAALRGSGYVTGWRQ